MTNVFAQDSVLATRNIRVPEQAERPESQSQLLQQTDGEPKSKKSEPTYGTSELQTSDDPRGLPKLKLTEFSGDFLEWPERAEVFDVILHQKRLSDTEKIQYLKISLTDQAKAAISWLGFSSQAYYQVWYILCKKFGRPRFIVEYELLNIRTHHPVRHNHSSSVVQFSNVVKYPVNLLTRLGFQHDLESAGVRSSANIKFAPQLKKQWQCNYRITDYGQQTWLYLNTG